MPCGCWLLVGSALGWLLLGLLALLLRGLVNFWFVVWLLLLWAGQG